MVSRRSSGDQEFVLRGVRRSACDDSVDDSTPTRQHGPEFRIGRLSGAPILPILLLLWVESSANAAVLCVFARIYFANKKRMQIDSSVV